MPIDDEKTFAEFGYHIMDLSHGSNKKFYYTCDDCGESNTKIMNLYSQMLKNKKIKGIHCYKCSQTKNKKYDYYENYFFIQNSENSYWAGFIAADGCIFNAKLGQKQLRINLSIKDKILLERFKSDIQYTGPIATFYSKPKRILDNKNITESKEYVKLEISSNKLCNDLWNNFKIEPRKSLILKPPAGLTFEQELAFIVGYIDGDGSIGLIKSKNQNFKYPIYFNFLGTEIFLNWINLKIHQLSDIDSKINVLKTKGNIYLLTGNGQFAYDVLKCLEAISVLKLDRKWDIIRNFEEPLPVTYCKRGHKWTDKTTYIRLNGNSKECKICIKERKCNKNTMIKNILIFKVEQNVTD